MSGPHVPVPANDDEVRWQQWRQAYAESSRKGAMQIQIAFAVALVVGLVVFMTLLL